jgi:hypothetical protein
MTGAAEKSCVSGRGAGRVSSRWHPLSYIDQINDMAARMQSGQLTQLQIARGIASSARNISAQAIINRLLE